AADGAIAKLQAKLDEAHGLVSALEEDAEAFFLGGQGGRCDELRRRLRLIVPVLAAGLAGVRAPGTARAKRNLASHAFDVPVAVIEGASQTALNRLQREGLAAIETTAAPSALCND
ncbi:unnamed protein product, partial [Prorocentrum cordatum]